MRISHAIKNDIRYQIKYGFYFLYLFMTIVYLGILYIVPDKYKDIGLSIIILTDPAMLGFFFIGGIWLLEKGEGLHKFYSISPLKPIEYIFSKASSLSIISTLSALSIVLFGIHKTVNYPMLLLIVFIGSMIFTLLGLTLATYAHSVNNYLLISIPVEVFITLPPILAAFGINHPILEVLPGTIFWQVVTMSIKAPENSSFIMPIISMVLWLGAAILLALLRIPAALQADGGEKL
ncbi:MAG: hypothetical protein K0R09_1284 [Clostridiales bacterium]|nr:hypothetical protein [Clostridiales bacterium]